MKEEHKVVNIMERKIAVSSSVVDASYSIGLNEKKIIYAALAKINQHVQGNLENEVSVTVEEFAALRGHIDENENLVPYRQDNARVELNIAIRKLFDRKIKLSNGEEHRWIYFFRDTEANKEANTVSFGWSPSLIPHLEDLKTYANLYAQSLVGMSGIYTHRFLEIFSQQKSGGRKEGHLYHSLEELIIKLKVPDSYHEFKAFNRYVLKPSLAELRNNKIMDVSVSYRKEGKTVVGITFEWLFMVRGLQVLKNAV